MRRRPDGAARRGPSRGCRRLCGLCARNRHRGLSAHPGNRGVDGDRAEFVTVSLWESRSAIEAFAGQDIEQAVFYPMTTST